MFSKKIFRFSPTEPHRPPLNAIVRTFGKRMAAIEVPLYPMHMQDCIRATCESITDFNLIYFYEWMLTNGYLTLPEDDRRGGLMTAVIAARLPQ